MTDTRRTTRMPHPAGFTLVEVLIAIGVFALGMVAVAALFPTAIIMQKQTTIAVDSETVAANARALLIADPFEYNYDVSSGTATLDSSAITATNKRVQIVPAALINSSGKWNARNRAYLGDLSDEDRAAYYWIPLIQNANGEAADPDWRIYAFIVSPDRRDAASDAYNHTSAANDDDADSIPKIKGYSANRDGINHFQLASASDRQYFGGGDYILTNTGLPYRILSVSDSGRIEVNGFIPDSDPAITGIWCSPRISEDRPSPAVGISIISEGVNVTIE